MTDRATARLLRSGLPGWPFRCRKEQIWTFLNGWTGNLLVNFK